MPRAIGDVRPSQVITTFGPGAIVDLQTVSVIVAGIDHWPVEEEWLIHEPRLQRALRVKRFFSAKPTQGSFFSRQGTVPTYIFPRFQVCPVCQTLSEISEGLAVYDSKWQEISCKAPGCKGRGKKSASTVPAPFIVACPSGHMDDFPWREYVHRGPTDCNRRMQLFSAGKTGTIADITIKCECSKVRSASEAFGERRSSAIGTCTRRRPWLGRGNLDSAQCAHATNVRAMQRGATNAWFPVVRTALAIKEASTPLGIALAACSAKQLERIDSVDKLRLLVDAGMFPSLERFAVEEVWSGIQKERGDVPTEDIDLRWPEWIALRDPAHASSDVNELFLEVSEVPEFLRGCLTQVVLARKLLEVRALVGFTRIDPSGGVADQIEGSTLAPISSAQPEWLPAVEVRGEGIFIELDERAVGRWESRSEVKARADVMAAKFEEWELERSEKPSPFPGARYVLLHTLAHVLIRQLSLDCGYSASSVRERIYSSTERGRPMAGILLYTASPDSEGSLGGLVDLGSPRRLSGLFASALKSAERCSSDPLCADHRPDVHATINAAACHACILASETSCETFNRFLDRNFLVATMASDSLAFFRNSPERSSQL